MYSEVHFVVYILYFLFKRPQKFMIIKTEKSQMTYLSPCLYEIHQVLANCGYVQVNVNGLTLNLIALKTELSPSPL